MSARMLGWEVHCDKPLVQLRQSIGQTGAIATETRAILAAENIRDGDFDDDVLACLPRDWRVTEEDVAQRRDFRCFLVIITRNAASSVSCSVLRAVPQLACFSL